MFNEITTGASNDIEQATKLARAMITRYGMTEEFDMVAMETVTNQYLGGDTSLSCSADTQKEIDRKVVELVKREHEKAKKLLADNREKLDELAMYLYEKETITGEEFMKILNNEKNTGNFAQAESLGNRENKEKVMVTESNTENKEQKKERLTDSVREAGEQA